MTLTMPLTLKHSFFLLMLAGLGLAGCGPLEGDEGLGTSEQTATAAYTYHCRELRVPRAGDAVRLRVTQTKVDITVVNHDLFSTDLSGPYDYNASYHPRTAAFQGHAQYASRASDNTVILLPQSMRTGGEALRIGGRGGFATLEGGHVSHGGRVDLLCLR